MTPGFNSAGVPSPQGSESKYTAFSFWFSCMARPFSFVFHVEPTDFRTIMKNGFISCLVTFQAPRIVTKRTGFCFHCKELLSYNGALKHSKQLVEKQHVDLSRLFCVEKVDFYKQQITSDVELLWEKWRTKESGSPKDSGPQLEKRGDSEMMLVTETASQHDTTHTAEESCLAEQSHRGSDGQPEITEQDPLFEEQWDYLEECLLSRWSCFHVFDSAQRFEEAEAIMNSLFDGVNDQKRNTMKSRIISLMFRQLSTGLSLSKNQNDQLVSFVKSMTIFIAPEKEEVARRIFASHTSRYRQSLKDQARKNILCKKYMEDCSFFSMAIDTALFGNLHFVSCIGQFSFDNKALEIPIFICQCAISSGKEMAVFLFQKLTERNVRFEKLVSVATDGAANMTGKYNGMTAQFK